MTATITQPLPNGAEFIVRLTYSNQEAHGVVVLVVISCISLVAVVGLLAVITISAFNTRTSLDQHLFVRTHVAAYFFSLLLCNLLQSIGSIINAGWINHKAVTFGDLCLTQGLLKHVSDVGTAFWTLVIAIHTFCLLFLELKMRTFVLWMTLFGGWSAIAALVVLGPATANADKRGSFYGISGYWCWISPQYNVERITLDYMIMFLVAFVCFALYALIFLRLRGNLVRTGWRLHFRSTTELENENGHKSVLSDDRAMTIARHMLLYPIAYIILLLPVASSRFAAWGGHRVPFEATIFTASVFLLSGLVNVILFTTTRHILPLESMKIGRRVISQPQQLPPPPDSHGVDPYYQTSHPVEQQDTSGESRSSSETSMKNSASTVSANSADSSLDTQTKRTKPRPPDIIITRDSIESMYSVYDEEEVPGIQHHGAQAQGALTSHWSPDHSPQRRSWLRFASWHGK